MVNVNCNILVKCFLTSREINNVIKSAARLIDKIKGEVEINVISEREMKKINFLYRKKNKITDVLSFAWQEEKSIVGDYLGQIFICYPQIVRQAKENKITIREEFIRMLVHGLLHLVGYNHAEKKGEAMMFALQEKIVARLLNV